jgi:hypothetical protein
MPKKKTGQKKKADKQKERQRGIRQAFNERPLADRPCNASMVRVADIIFIHSFISDNKVHS